MAKIVQKSLTSSGDGGKPTLGERWQRLCDWAVKAFDYCCEGVWQDSRRRWWIKLVKVINLTVRGFLDGDLQSKACAMTYRTILAIVPGLALLFAIGRGFGMQDYITREIYSYLPSQRKVLEMAFNFVDSYLKQASEGLFVGIGIGFLLWTLVSLLSSVEDVFNSIFNVKNGRNWWRKIADYTAILLIIPVLMICASGITIFMTTALHKLFDFGGMTPVFNTVIDCLSYVLVWMSFAGAYLLIPNTRVKPLNAIVAGIIAGTAFQVLQWLFMTGQMYVTRYNAIYGSFSFLPLMLLWLQLVWLITFVCAGICYSSQNIFRFAFDSQVRCISAAYRLRVEVAIMAVIVQRFQRGMAPMSAQALMRGYGLPPRLVNESVTRLVGAGLVNYATSDEPDQQPCEVIPLQPSHCIDDYTVGKVIGRLNASGEAGFIPTFKYRFETVGTLFDRLSTAVDDSPEGATRLDAIKIPL